MTTKSTPIVFTLDAMKKELNELLIKYKNDVSGFFGPIFHGPDGYLRAIELQGLVNNTSNESSPELFFINLYKFYNKQNAFSSTLMDDLQLTLEKFVGVGRPLERDNMLMIGLIANTSGPIRHKGDNIINEANAFMSEFEKRVKDIEAIVNETQNTTEVVANKQSSLTLR